MIQGIFKTIFIFILTFKYLIQSYFFPKNILNLKQQWAHHVLNLLGYQINIAGQFRPYNRMIFVGNHVSFIDILILIATNPKISFVAKKEIRSWPIIGWGAERIGTIFVDRESKDSKSSAKEQLRQSFENKAELHLALFPSGTTQLSELKPWKKGIFEVAQQTQTPIQMFYIHYEPLRESAYIDDDHLLTNLMGLFQKENKKVTLYWRDLFMCENAIEDCDKQRKSLLTFSNTNRSAQL